MAIGLKRCRFKTPQGVAVVIASLAVIALAGCGGDEVLASKDPVSRDTIQTADMVKAHFQLKQSQARVNVSARHRELFNTELGLYGLPEHRQMTVTFDPTQTWFDVEQCRGYPTVAL